MLHYFLEVEGFIDEGSKFYPNFNVLESRRVHDGIIEQKLAELHELVDLLHKEIFTMVRLLLSSSFMQMLVMYSTYRIFLL